MPDLDVGQLMSVAEAAAAIDAVPVMPRTVHTMQVSLTDAVGRRLAEDVTTDRDYPPFDKSLMDGFAALVGEPAGAFDLVGEVPAGGEWAGNPLRGRQAVAIMTGAPLPPGEGEVGIVPVEHARQTGDAIHLDLAPQPDRWIARRGSDRPERTVVLRKGTLLGPQHVAALATVGCARITVFKRPACAILATGDEIVGIGQRPSATQARDANTPMLAALLARLGCEVTSLGRVPDDAGETRERIAAALGKFDCVFVTGGMSMGEHDHVWRTLAELTKVKVAKLKVKPGKPFVFGDASSHSLWSGRTAEGERTSGVECHPRFAFGLPGNPVSAFVCTLVLASRLLTRLGGGDIAECDRRFMERPLAEALPANGPRQFYQPARLEAGRVVPLKWRGSADVFTLAEADVLIERPADDGPREAGAAVRVLALP